MEQRIISSQVNIQQQFVSQQLALLLLLDKH